MAKEKKQKKEIEEQEEVLEPADRVRNFFKELVPYVVIIFIVALIRTFIITPVSVKGDSMYPYLKDGEILLLNKLDKSFKRFDIVVANAKDTKVIKRIIGLPGEHIKYEDCKLYIDNKEIKDVVSECITNDFTLEEVTDNYAVIPEGYYFVMGDNRKASSDSRNYLGLISKNQISGTASFRLYPFNVFGKLKLDK